MKTLPILLLLFTSCVTVKYPGHDYTDRLVIGTTKNAYLTEDIYGRKAMKIHADTIDSTRVGQWLVLRDEFNN